MALMSILTAAGLAGASGHRAFIPVLGLGALHHYAAMTVEAGKEPFFALSESFAWVADPVVMSVLGVLAVVEILAEMNPDVPELVNLAGKLPKAAAGFIATAALVGTLNENAMLLGASGLLGGAGALTVDSLRAQVKSNLDEPLADASDGWSTKLFSVAETGWSAGMVVVAFAAPVLVLLAGGALFALWRVGKKREEAAFEKGDPDLAVVQADADIVA